MARTWLWMRPWRWVALALGVIVPVVAVVAIQTFMPLSALRYDPPQPRVIAVGYREALALQAKGDLAGAQKRLEALRDENPLNPLVNAALGQVHRQAGDTARAIAATRMAVGLDPGLGEGWYNLACDLVKTGQLEEALRALRQAVKAGFDVRTPAETDPDLATLREDQRLQMYLEGAGIIPLSDRSATFRVQPGSPVVAQPFDLELELLAMNQPVSSGAPDVSVAFRGPSEVEVLAPLKLERLREETTRGDKRRYRWLYRYRMVARAHFAGQIGPWEIKIGGAAVPVEAPALVVTDGTGEGSAEDTSLLAEVPETVPSLRADRFFAQAGAAGKGALEVAPLAAPIVRVDAAPDGEGWLAGAIVLTVAPLPAGGPGEIDAHFESGLAPLAEYDELELSPDRHEPVQLRRVYAFASEVLPMVMRAPVTVRVGAQRSSLRIASPASQAGTGAAITGAGTPPPGGMGVKP